MAKIITEIDPCCELLVAKVGNAKTDLSRHRVMEAFEWARKSGADIISFSATFDESSPELEIAVQKVIGENVIVIASLADDGQKSKKVYPADFDSVLKISATDSRGDVLSESDHDKNDDKLYYKFIGERVVATTRFLGSDFVSEEVTGNSVGTAVRSGVIDPSLRQIGSLQAS